jgi:hypothetical protein
MDGALITSFFIAGFVILVWSIMHLFNAENGIQTRWRGAIRHSVAVAVALCAFVVLFTLLQLLHLFERDLFSLSAFLGILHVSSVLLVSGGVVILGALILARR